jgi:hypothetical protein
MNTVCDENGRYIICELELSNARIIVTNFYGLNTDNTLLLESFIDEIDNFNDKPLICGGDWNLVEQLEKIHLNPHSASIMFSFSLVKCVSCNM